MSVRKEDKKSSKILRIKCPICEVDFGQEKRFREHLAVVHDLPYDLHEDLYVKFTHDGVRPVCGCGCGEGIKWNGWKRGYQSKYVRGHNASVYTPFSDPDQIAKNVAKRVDGYASGRLVVWNVGITKENDERTRLASEKKSKTLRQKHASGEIVTWSTGLTKHTDERIKQASDKHKEGYASGRIQPWNEGQTKETCPKLAEIGAKIAIALDKPGIGRRITMEEVIRRIDAVGHETLTLVSDPSEYRKFKHTRLKFRCSVCGNTQLKTLYMFEKCPVCHVCHPNASKAQIEVFDFIKAHCSDAIICDRKMIAPFELDVYVPSKKFAIEYNGLYWHSSPKCPPSHVDDKLALAKEAGVNLFIIFEDEWRDKRRIVEQMIEHRLGIFSHRVGARECSIVELTSFQKRDFFDDNHLEGDARSQVAFGLKDRSGVIVAAMSLRRPFHKKYEGKLEVSRASCRLGWSVPGWLSRLTRHCVRHSRDKGVGSLITYVDGRVGTGGAYETAGFHVVKESTGARFWWTDFNSRFDRFRFRADKTRNMTQADIAEESGVVRIFGASSKLLEIS